MPTIQPSRFHSVAERMAWGQSRRRVLGRAAVGEWKPSPGRPGPAALLLASEKGRVASLLPLKHARMAASPFGFFRGAAPLMAWDLGHRPRSGIGVQLCGDAHVRNLGAFAAPDGHLVFDINDFDETTPGPWEWDLGRLAASFVLAAREAGNTERAARESVRVLSRAYREGLRRFASMPVLEVVRYEIRRHLEEGPLRDVLRRAERTTPQASLEKLTRPSRGGERRFVSQPPLLSRVPDRSVRQVLASLGRYRTTVDAARRLVLDAYLPVDVAFKVVGTGSVGTRDYVVLLLDGPGAEPLFLQVKEALASCWVPWLPGVKVPAHHGERVAEGQHRMQTVSDPFLGWTTVGGRPFLVRQLSDHKASVDPATLRGSALLEYALVVGEVFAKAHARTGDPVALLGYAGRSERLDEALVRFAALYADQTEKDHAAFVAALRPRKGRRSPAAKRRPPAIRRTI